MLIQNSQSNIPEVPGLESKALIDSPVLSVVDATALINSLLPGLDPNNPESFHTKTFESITLACHSMAIEPGVGFPRLLGWAARHDNPLLVRAAFSALENRYCAGSLDTCVLSLQSAVKNFYQAKWVGTTTELERAKGALKVLQGFFAEKHFVEAIPKNPLTIEQRHKRDIVVSLVKLAVQWPIHLAPCDESLLSENRFCDPFILQNDIVIAARYVLTQNVCHEVVKAISRLLDQGDLPDPYSKAVALTIIQHHQPDAHLLNSFTKLILDDGFCSVVEIMAGDATTKRGHPILSMAVREAFAKIDSASQLENIQVLQDAIGIDREAQRAIAQTLIPGRYRRPWWFFQQIAEILKNCDTEIVKEPALLSLSKYTHGLRSFAYRPIDFLTELSQAGKESVAARRLTAVSMLHGLSDPVVIRTLQTVMLKSSSSDEANTAALALFGRDAQANKKVISLIKTASKKENFEYKLSAVKACIDLLGIEFDEALKDAHREEQNPIILSAIGLSLFKRIESRKPYTFSDPLLHHLISLLDYAPEPVRLSLATFALGKILQTPALQIHHQKIVSAMNSIQRRAIAIVTRRAIENILTKYEQTKNDRDQ